MNQAHEEAEARERTMFREAEKNKRYRVIQIDQWNDGKVTETVLGENLTEEAAKKIDHGANSNPDDSRTETTTRLEEME